MSIKDEVIEILSSKAAQLYGVDAKTLGRDTNFEEDLHAKSVHIVQFSAILEDEYELEVPFMEFKKRATFGDIADWIAAEFGE
jgi:acyl carrier protein